MKRKFLTAGTAILFSAGICIDVCAAGEQIAQGPSHGSCVASVVRAGGPNSAASAVAFSAPTPGVRYLVQNGYFQIVSVDGMTVKTVNAANQTATWFAGMLYSSHQIDKASVEAIWPLEVGKTVTFLEQADKDAWCHTLTVQREETVSLQAGNFSTIVIEDRFRSIGGEQGGLDVLRTFWYAPSVNWVVKREIKQISGPPFQSGPYAVTQIVVASEGPKIVNVPWPKVACDGAHFVLPFTQKHDCYQGPVGKGDDGSCHTGNFGTAGGDESLAFEIYLDRAGGRCGVYFAGDDVIKFIKNATAVTRNGRDFSDTKRFGDTEVMRFTGRGGKGPLDCFAFATLGPHLRRTDNLYRYAMRGHVCRPDGSKLNDSEIAQLASAINAD